MKVLFCTLDYPPNAVGGAENQARLQAEELVRRGHVVHVVCARSSAVASGEVNGVRVHRLPRLNVRRLRTLSYLFALFAFLLLRLRWFDLVHVHLANLQADTAVAAARVLGRPSYLKLAAGGPLGDIGRLRRVALLTRYYGIRRATMVQAISAEIAIDLARIGVSRERIRLIPNGVVLPDDGMASPGERADARTRLGISLDTLVVLFAGRIEREKGVQDLIKVWSATPLPNSTLILLGTPGTKDPVPTDDLPPNMEYRGWTPDVSSFLAASDIFVLPSYAEGMSNAILEAMVAGVPVIASRVGAAPEMIQDGDSGLLVDPGDREGVKAALEMLASDPDARQRIGEAGRSYICQNLGIDSVVSRIEAAYRSIVST